MSSSWGKEKHAYIHTCTQDTLHTYMFQDSDTNVGLTQTFCIIVTYYS